MFPFDILEQAFQGNSVAWEAMAFGIISVIMFSFLIVLWWKMPQLAKSQFVNNTIGGQSPTIAQCYDNRRVRFFNPKVMRSGFAISKGALYLFPKLWANADTELEPAQKDMLNAVYTMDGTSSPFYVNYAIQAGMLNPGIVAMIENEKLMQQLKPNSPVFVDKKVFKDIIDLCPEPKIQVAPLHFSFPISDIRALKTWLPKSLSKSNFAELENKVRQDERGNKEGINLQTVIVLVLVVNVIISIVGLAHGFGWI